MKKAKQRSTAGALRSPQSAAAGSSAKKGRKSNLSTANRDLQMSPYNDISLSKPGKQSSGSTKQTKKMQRVEQSEAFASQAELIAVEDLRVQQEPATVEVSYNEEQQQVVEEIIDEGFGTWSKDVQFEEIEAYLVSSQRKFVKYKLNIFYLNRCALKIQHYFHKRKQLRILEQRRREAAQKKAASSLVIQTNIDQNVSSGPLFLSPIHSAQNVTLSEQQQQS